LLRKEKKKKKKWKMEYSNLNLPNTFFFFSRRGEPPVPFSRKKKKRIELLPWGWVASREKKKRGAQGTRALVPSDTRGGKKGREGRKCPICTPSSPFFPFYPGKKKGERRPHPVLYPVSSNLTFGKGEGGEVGGKHLKDSIGLCLSPSLLPQKKRKGGKKKGGKGEKKKGGGRR